jgi:2-polyprenyl-3-methyl-5-hydroxy-6-metoxy-1,4-benzoquinol methylase
MPGEAALPMIPGRAPTGEPHECENPDPERTDPSRTDHARPDDERMDQARTDQARRDHESTDDARPDPERADHERKVRSMFGRIAPSYDLLNRVLSLGIDQRWRRAMLACAGDVDGRTVIDACCGTGDVALAFARRGARVVGVDFTPQMLVSTKPRIDRT